ncbi:hypothetical protein quinque_007434 [Culex quinquefasciatus]
MPGSVPRVCREPAEVIPASSPAETWTRSVAHVQEHHVEDKNTRRTRHSANLIPRHLLGIGPSRRYGHDVKEHINEHRQRSWTYIATSATKCDHQVHGLLF